MTDAEKKMSAVDYRHLLWKYITVLVGRDHLSDDVCPGCLNTESIFTEEESAALHDLLMGDEPERMN